MSIINVGSCVVFIIIVRRWRDTVHRYDCLRMFRMWIEDASGSFTLVRDATYNCDVAMLREKHISILDNEGILTRYLRHGFILKQFAAGLEKLQFFFPQIAINLSYDVALSEILQYWFVCTKEENRETNMITKISYLMNEWTNVYLFCCCRCVSREKQISYAIWVPFRTCLIFHIKSSEKIQQLGFSFYSASYSAYYCCIQVTFFFFIYKTFYFLF